MESSNQMHLVKDVKNNRITIDRKFQANRSIVWRAWTESKILDQWWGPKPWKAETKSMDFQVGGTWLYAMVGPNNEKHWSKMDYTSIDHEIRYVGNDAFCDENGEVDPALPAGQWISEFKDSGEDTMVSLTLNFDSEADLNKLLETGFETGIAMCMNNLDEYLVNQAQ